MRKTYTARLAVPLLDDIVFEYVFSGLDPTTRQTSSALVPDGKDEAGGAHHDSLFEPDQTSRLRAKRWCTKTGVGLTADMMENCAASTRHRFGDASGG